MTLAAGATVLLLAGLTARLFFRPSSAQTDAQSHLRQGEQALVSRDYPEALARLTHCLEGCPFNGEANFLLARTYRIGGQKTDAQRHLIQAAILHWPKVQIELESQLQRAQVGDIWQVEDSLLKQVNQHPPEEVFILEALVSGLLANDRLVDVLVITTAWVNLFPEDWLPRIYRGNARLRLNANVDEAIQDFQRVLELKPDNPESHLSLAIILTKEGDLENALPHFQTSVSRQPKDKRGLFGLANCQYTLGKSSEARATLTRLFATGQEDAAAYLLQAKIELAEGCPEKALPWLQKADALAPKEGEVINSLMLVCGQLGQTEQADKYRRLLDEVNARDAELHKLATAYMDRPWDADLRFQLGEACLKYGRNDEASHWFQGILWKDPDHLPTLNVLSAYYQSIGNQKMADHYRRRAEKVSGQATRRSAAENSLQDLGRRIK
jgi:Flp pilus assembly protein TadD